ncbi:hypothetical protein [Streptomyces nigra]|uniref:hypothetical protein n=1 Tax=Streptomyces nigra TaxID=1827580 RepID=UPI00362F437E
MTLADRRAAALRALTHRAAPGQHRYPGETQPSGDMPDDPVRAEPYLSARRWDVDDEPSTESLLPTFKEPS